MTTPQQKPLPSPQNLHLLLLHLKPRRYRKLISLLVAPTPDAGQGGDVDEVGDEDVLVGEGAAGLSKCSHTLLLPLDLLLSTVSFQRLPCMCTASSSTFTYIISSQLPAIMILEARPSKILTPFINLPPHTCHIMYLYSRSGTPARSTMHCHHRCILHCVPE